MKIKKSIRIVLGILLLGVLLVIFANVILKSIASPYLNQEITKINEEKEYILSVEDFNINIFLGRINIEGLSIKPKEEFLDSLVNGTTKERTLKAISASKVTFSGWTFLSYLTKKQIDVKKIIIDQLNFNLYRPQKNYQVKMVDKEKESSFSIDSIYISGVKKISLTEVKIENYGFHIIDASNMDTISAYKGNELIIDGIDLEPVEDKIGYFHLDNSALEIQLQKQEFNLSGGLYVLSFENFLYTFGDEHISIDGLNFKPRLSNAEVMSTSKYSSEVYDIAIKNISIAGFDLDPFIHSGVLYIDQIAIDSMTTLIAKDKSKPFYEDKRVLLPVQGLKKTNQPLQINSISITNSFLNYSEQDKAPKDLLNLDMSEINATILNISSLKDYVSIDKDLTIDFKAKLLSTPIETYIKMPYNSSDGRFYFSGNSLGATNFTFFNSTILPAIGVKLVGGRLNGLSWEAIGNSTAMDGSFTMLYTDLEVELFKKDNSENKALSWIANTLVKSSNPSKSGKTTVSTMHFERVPYKGIGNYLWKSIQSGIVNALVPTGKHESVKTEKEEKPVKKKKSKNSN
ncbi:hypothetical protein [uncultured Eudoraea sp.]|uniref:hypothetical protein n=1 Tax=uncultured Eudoraea sp. TaxID=1035614 RepID=UPI0026115D2D|nr:hypothetical protein [uncultured Eudoraea sp.]